MRHGNVVTLVVDIAHRLPVHVDLAGHDRPGRQDIGRAPVGEIALERRQKVPDGGLRPGAEADEHEAVPDLQVQ